MLTYEAETDYDDKPGYEIYRIMTDKKHQGKGYAKEAVRLLLEYIKIYPCGRAENVYIELHPDNVASRRLFEGYNFAVKGTKEDGAVVAKLALN